MRPGSRAISLVCERLDGGFLTAVDRSAKMIEAASRRNAEHVAAGRAEFLVAAMALFPKIEDADLRAAALVTTAGIIFDTDASWGAQVLSEAVKTINRADRYDGRVYGVTLEAPGYKEKLAQPKEAPAQPKIVPSQPKVAAG